MRCARLHCTMVVGTQLCTVNKTAGWHRNGLSGFVFVTETLGRQPTAPRDSSQEWRPSEYQPSSPAAQQPLCCGALFCAALSCAVLAHILTPALCHQLCHCRCFRRRRRRRRRCCCCLILCRHRATWRAATPRVPALTLRAGWTRPLATCGSLGASTSGRPIVPWCVAPLDLPLTTRWPATSM